MNTNALADFLGNSAYVFLTLNFLWGLFCVIMLWRRVMTLRFTNDQLQLQFLGELRNNLDKGDFNSASEMCQNDQRALPQLALAAIENRDLGEGQLRQLIAELMQRNVLSDLEYRLSWVATVIKSGPLLGLFGTVLGMMAAFGRIGLGDKPDPKQIAADISIALICTAMGLMTAIPFTFVLANLNIRVRVLQDSLSSGMTRFLEHFKLVCARFVENDKPESASHARTVPA
ncbi:MAG: MotA/TolQ/ExbB proton channel family protein [Thermoguttaceae bacterium]